MIRYSKNKNELLVLTGAVYSFVAYLTAFTLEVLFIIDLAKRTSNGIIPIVATSSLSSKPLSTSTLSPSSAFISTQSAFSTTRLPPTFTNSGSIQDNESIVQQQSAYEQAKLMLETMQSHMTISCLAISILYFIIFVSSLALITALILRSTFFLMIWICAMSAMCLPEFGLIIYVSIYGWGLDSRNGQTELLFYLFRVALNVIFVFRAHRLYKDWIYEKNFFMLKSGSNNAVGGSRFLNSYDSPYFIGDSLTTTINPVFSSSTLNLDQYDHIQDYHHITSNRFSTNTLPSNNYANYSDYDLQAQARAGRPRSGHLVTNSNSRTPKVNQFYLAGEEPDCSANSGARHNLSMQQQNSIESNQSEGPRKLNTSKQSSGLAHQSMISIEDNDEFADYEMDLDYRTLTNQHHYTMTDQHNSPDQQDINTPNRSHQPVGRIRSREPPSKYTSTGPDQDIYMSNESASGEYGRLCQPGLSYSTQSLDRRHLRDFDFSLPEQVTLRPLGHQPFEYLRRPGSTTNLNSINNLNTQPSPKYLSSTKLHDLHHRYH